MDEKSRITLDLISADKSISWVRDQLVASFAEGIAQSAKERSLVDAPIDLQLADAEITQRERTKREKYETSRPYDESEKIELITHALHEVFVTVPAVQLAATSALRDLGAKAAEIEFSSPEEENVETTPNRTINMQPAAATDLQHRFEAFKAKLAST